MTRTIQRAIKTAACSSLLLVSALAAVGQGTFRNLDFESAKLSPVPAGQYGGLVSVSDALPGWTAFLGTNQLTQVLQNNLTLGNASVDVLGPNWSYGGILQGQYSVVLQPGYDPSDPFHRYCLSASITQVGLVPADAKTIRLSVSAYSPFSVILAGQELSLLPVAAGPNYTVYGADISSLAGQTGALTITALAAFNNTDAFDSIQFSDQPIPEPSALSVSGLAVLFAGARALSRRRFVRIANEITRANAGGPRQLPIRAQWTARIAKFRR